MSERDRRAEERGYFLPEEMTWILPNEFEEDEASPLIYADGLGLNMEEIDASAKVEESTTPEKRSAMAVEGTNTSERPAIAVESTNTEERPDPDREEKDPEETAPE